MVKQNNRVRVVYKCGCEDYADADKIAEIESLGVNIETAIRAAAAMECFRCFAKHFGTQPLKLETSDDGDKNTMG